MENVLQTIYQYLATYGLSIVAAVIIFVIGRWLAKLIAKLIARLMTRANVDKTLTKFTQSLCYAVLFFFVIIAALAKLGIQTASFIVVAGAAGFAVGLALQGSLANFASGVLMLILRPFKVGDFVEIAGAKGKVKQIQIFNTIINTLDNIKVIVPNAKVTADKIMNYTANGSRRIDLTIAISYGDDLRKAKQVIEEVLADDQRILKDPPPTVAVSELADSGVNFVVRPWVKCEDYWDVYFDTTTKIKLALDQNKITIPFPQSDIHIKDAVLKKPDEILHAIASH